MQIITAPHQTLRTKAKPIEKLDKKTVKFLHDLKTTLQNKQDPPGVGLAAPQVNESKRVFAIRPVKARGDEGVEIKLFANPEIIDHSPDKVLGQDADEPDMEGCLSIPKIYGPVPRWSWIKLQYELFENGKLISKTKKFSHFTARIIQHELDHLDGILFTDYLIEHNLPAYMAQGDELIEIKDRSILDVY